MSHNLQAFNILVSQSICKIWRNLTIFPFQVAGWCNFTVTQGLSAFPTPKQQFVKLLDVGAKLCLLVSCQVARYKKYFISLKYFHDRNLSARVQFRSNKSSPIACQLLTFLNLGSLLWEGEWYFTDYILLMFEIH